MVHHGPEVLYDGSEPIAADIVFVHGLRGDAIDTWSKGAVCWPRDLLKEDLPDARVISWGYDSNITTLKGFSSQNSIFGHAENLLSDLARKRRSTDEEKRPLIFVGHSLGGLVIKEALTRASEYLHNRQNESLGALFTNTKGVVFMGTPHRGSDRTSLGHLIVGAARFSLKQPNHTLLNTLAQESDVLERQRKAFDSISASIPLTCLYEEIPTAVGLIVPQHSACMDGFRVKSNGIPADHMLMCKYANPNDIGYQRTSGHLFDMLRDARKELTQTDRLITERILRSLHFEAIDYRYDEIAEAHRKTFNWIFERSSLDPDHISLSEVGDHDHENIHDANDGHRQCSFLDWLKSDGRLFWFNGKAGSGKSTLLKFVYNETRTQEALKAGSGSHDLCVAAFFFHNRGSSIQKSHLWLLRCVLLQILERNPILVKLVFPREFRPDGLVEGPLSTYNWSLHQLEVAFHKIVLQTELKLKICLFIDGLDEYGGDPEMMARLFAQYTENIQNEYTIIKCCISSRPLPVIEEYFHRFPSLRLQDLTSRDISIYVSDTLKDYPSWQRLVDMHEMRARIFIGDIVTKASGVFLWVILVVKSLINGVINGDSISELQARLDEVPSDLYSLYRRMVDSIEPRYRQQARLIFETIKLKEERMYLYELVLAERGPLEALKQPQYSQRSTIITEVACQAMIKRINSRCLGLVELGTIERNRHHVGFREVRYIHETVRDFFEDLENLALLSSVKNHEATAYISLASMSLCLLKTAKTDRWHSEWSDLTDRHDQFSGYLEHAKSDTSKIELVKRMLEDSKRAVKRVGEELQAIVRHWASRQNVFASLDLLSTLKTNQVLYHLAKEAQKKCVEVFGMHSGLKRVKPERQPSVNRHKIIEFFSVSDSSIIFPLALSKRDLKQDDEVSEEDEMSNEESSDGESLDINLSALYRERDLVPTMTILLMAILSFRAVWGEEDGDAFSSILYAFKTAPHRARGLAMQKASHPWQKRKAAEDLKRLFPKLMTILEQKKLDEDDKVMAEILEAARQGCSLRPPRAFYV